MAPSLFMHELDRNLYEILCSMPKYQKLFEAYNNEFDEHAARLNLLSSAVRLSEKQMPEVYGLLPPICEKLGIEIPELYYVVSTDLNAYTAGNKAPYIVISSGLINTLPLSLLSTVLAHECGHIACKHVLFHSVAEKLVEGADMSPLAKIPGIRKCLTPITVKTLLFWYRCSELSADRAAVLCDGNADNMIDVLLRVNGYGENIDRTEFMKQAMELGKLVKESETSTMIEQMLTQGENHPRLATRAYECFEWAHSQRYLDVLSGKYTLEVKEQEAEIKKEKKELVRAEAEIKTNNSMIMDIMADSETEQKLEEVNKKLERYTCDAEKTDYAYAVICGLVAAAVDSALFAEPSISGNDIGFSHRRINNFIEDYAQSKGLKKDHLMNTISALEDAFKVPQDNIWKGADIGVSAKNHHLADMAHHPTLVGLISSVAAQMLRIGTFVNRDGEWHFIFIKTNLKEIAEILAPAILTGVLNWLACLAENKIEDEGEETLPEAIKKLIHLAVSAPVLIEMAKCTDIWFGHLVSDMGGSKNTPGGGMGIPGVFVSMLYELSSLPALKDSGLPKFVNDLYVNGCDMRHELVLYDSFKLQSIPVLMNEVTVRTGYFLLTLLKEVLDKNGFKGINWNRVVPVNNATVDRMLMVASMTFTTADTVDAAARAAMESGANWVLFSGRFITRFNYVGAGRAALSVVKEISNESKEAELIHEKLILTESKTKQVISLLEEYKKQLSEMVSGFLAEDIEAFMNGLSSIKEGMLEGNSDLVIFGNVQVTRKLGHEVQFTNQQEFEDLMDSDTSFVF